MAIVDQKQRYRRQAALCYEIAATMTGERAASMIQLGDTYAALAVDSDRLLPIPTAKHAEAYCKKCGKIMQLARSPPRSLKTPAMQAFRCETCGETLIRKGETPSAPTALAEESGWITRYVAISFRRSDEHFAPGPIVECPDASLAIQRAELMTRDADIVGSVAFSRRSNPVTGEFEAAQTLEIFGDIPEDFDIA
jgi:hypothetical protein